MNNPLEEQIAQLQQAIAAQESLRGSLGDAVVDATISVLQDKLGVLAAQAAPDAHKQATILVVDVSDITAPAPADVGTERDARHTFLAGLHTAIAHYGGKIDRQEGQTVIAAFGAAVPHQDDPERATRAALQVLADLAELRPTAQMEPPLRIRIGISTGPVELAGGMGKVIASGDVVRIAAGLMQAAPNASILISHETHHHVAGSFDILPLEPITMPGQAERLPAYMVLAERPRAVRGAIRGVAGVVPTMIGREDELRCLQEALAATQETQQPQMVTVVGEGGVGKSRLLYEYGRWLDSLPQAVRVFNGRTDEQMSTLPYALIRTLLAGRFAIRDNDRAVIARAKLELGIRAIMGQDGTEAAHFLGHLIGFDFFYSPYLRGILRDAQQIRARAFHYATRFFAAATRERPAVLFLDDVHWADDGSLDLLEYLVREGRDIPLLIVCLARPTLFDRRLNWGLGHTRLDLPPLSDEESGRLVAEILQKVALIPPELSRLVVGSAEGNPFYVEELIKKLIEDAVILPDEDGWRVESTRLAETHMPSTLTGLLHARLDALPTAERDALQRAAVVGRVFWESAVESLSTGVRTERTSIYEILLRLRAKELIFDRETATFAGEQEYVFKHALLHDVAYERVPRRLRRAYHAEAAAWLIAHSGERAAEYAGVIARHYEQAGEHLAAAEWYIRAGKQAQDTYAAVAAIAFYEKALAFLPEDPAYAALRIAPYEGLALMLRLGGLRLDGAEAAVTAMATAAEIAGDQVAQVRAWLGLASTYDTQRNYRAALESAQQAEVLAGTVGAQVERALALFTQGWEHYRLGEAETALELGAQALALSTTLGARPEMSLSYNLLGTAHNTLGHWEQATHYMEQALALDRELGALHNVASTLNNLAVGARARGDYQAALHLHREALAVAQQSGFRSVELASYSGFGGAYVGLGDYAAAEAALREVLGRPEAAQWVGLSPAHRFLAEACLGQDKPAEALAAALRALELAQETAQQEHSGAAWRVLGLVAARQAEAVPIGTEHYTAPACFVESLRIFTAMGAEGQRARTLRAWGWYERQQGHAPGEKLWIEARNIFAQLGMTFEVARMRHTDAAAMPIAG